MNAMFTQHAIDRMRERGIDQADVIRLLDAVELASDNPSALAERGNLVRVGRKQGEEAYIIRAGDMRAVITSDPSQPGQLVVVSVFQAEDSEKEHQRLGLRDGITPAKAW